MINQDTVFIPQSEPSNRAVRTSRSMAAVQLASSTETTTKLGTLLQLPAGTLLQVCGTGFNDRTTKVKSNERYYFVFIEDLEAAKQVVRN